jgi:carbonic anhydrase
MTRRRNDGPPLPVRKNSAVLANLESKGTIKIAGAMYNLETGAVEFFT